MKGVMGGQGERVMVPTWSFCAATCQPPSNAGALWSARQHIQVCVLMECSVVKPDILSSVPHAGGINLSDGLDMSDLKGLAGAFSKAKQNPNANEDDPTHVAAE